MNFLEFTSESDGLRLDNPDGGGAKAAGAMTAAYLEMLIRNRKNSDKYYHCIVNCMASQYGPGRAMMA